jgi:hypothetical protein
MGNSSVSEQLLASQEGIRIYLHNVHLPYELKYILARVGNVMEENILCECVYRQAQDLVPGCLTDQEAIFAEAACALELTSWLPNENGS